MNTIEIEMNFSYNIEGNEGYDNHDRQKTQQYLHRIRSFQI